MDNNRKKRLEAQLNSKGHIWIRKYKSWSPIDGRQNKTYDIGDSIEQPLYIHYSTTELKKSITIGERQSVITEPDNLGYVYEVEVVVKKIYKAATLEPVESTKEDEPHQEPENLEDI